MNENFIYEITDFEEKGKKKNKKFRIPAKKVLSFVLAMVIGSGVTLGVGSLYVPKLVKNEVQKNYVSGALKDDKVNPSMTAEQSATPVANSDKKLLSVVEIAKKVGPTVVGINTKTQSMSIFGRMQESEGSGSGIILTADGYIVTNNHVIDGANSITVVLSDGKEYEAKLTGADSRTDLAVIKIDAANLPYATLGNSSDLQVGELAVAIGNPLGNELAGTVTGGYISALNRSIIVDDKEFNLIQTDAAINPGNSGGALVNNYGEVIGINSVKMSAEGVEGIGFAIPIDTAKPIIEDLKTSGYVTGRPVIGIGGRNVTQQDSVYYNIPVGIYVSQISPYSAAEKAGLQIGDVITEFNGEKVTTVDELNGKKEAYKVGDTVTLTYVRNGETRKSNLTLTEEKPVSSVE